MRQPAFALDLRRIPQALAIAILAGYALAALIAVPQHWYMDDADAYWNAALRIREGQPLYFSAPADPAHPTIYRYAPWFAYAWLPLTYLPQGLVMALWGAVLVAAAAWLVWPRQWSPAAVALSLLCLPDLLRVTSTGNVQPLLLAALAWRLSPWMIGLAASLKPWALAFAIVHWRSPWKIAAAVAIAGLLWLPVLGAPDYPPPIGGLPPGSLAVALVVAARLGGRAGSAGDARAQPPSSAGRRPAPRRLLDAACAALRLPRSRG